MNMPDFKWDDKSTALLQKCVADGLTSGTAVRLFSKTFGKAVSRNMLIGKARRIGLSFDGTRSASIAPIVILRMMSPPKVKKQPVRRETTQRFFGEVKAPPKPATLAIEPMPKADVWLPLPGSKPVSLFNRKPDQCKWPVGAEPFLFCGQPRTGQSYCATHHTLSLPRRS